MNYIFKDTTTTEKGSNGIRCKHQKLNTTQTAKASPQIPSARSRSFRSRRSAQSARVTPETPKPSRAVDITRKPKWYHSDTDSIRVNASSSSRVARESKNNPAKCRARISTASEGEGRDMVPPCNSVNSSTENCRSLSWHGLG